VRIYFLGTLVLLNVVLAAVLLRVSEKRNQLNGNPGYSDERLREIVIAVLVSHGVEKSRIRERTFAQSGRIEFRATLPKGKSTAIVNFEISQGVRNIRCRSAAREDSRSGTVTIHIARDGFIVNTVILRQQMN
jgi:hypothetical protein